MKIFFTILSLALSLSTFAQTPVNLNIYHKLGVNDFAYNAASQNNMTNGAFKLTRMEYYLTKFTIIHDGGQLTTIPSTVIAMVKANELTSIPLGSYNITTVEGVKFHVGVHTPANHEDPSVLPLDHPLSFQSPSMHWGWSSGYRFIALEGKSGSALNQTMELHTVGDPNYLETTVTAAANIFNGELYINLDADYTRALENIAISSGPIVHGETGAPATVAQNFKNYVFSASASSAGLEEEVQANIKIFPVPSNGSFTIETPSTFVGNSMKIYNAKGQVIGSYILSNGLNSLQVDLKETGVFIVEFYNDDKRMNAYQIINK